MYKSPLFFGIIFPVLMVLAGWWAYQRGHLDGFWFLYSAVMPALLCALGWGAVLLNEVVTRRERQRISRDPGDAKQRCFNRALAPSGEFGNQPEKSGLDQLADTIEIINLILPWTGSAANAVAWYRTRPLPALDGQTAEQLVNQGRVDVVKAHMARMAPADLV